ncbi:O-antigen ligase family protein [Cohaesibacter celericrescens]|uniref:O-antigen ligase-related domain-containing protein n=1 Tax=Cohaesibacter celericrescens TaxID=2067669 RepID=A0A2N5XUQ2_9HYPH|nr:O-antigen ligase family protein [Cohaesibacter celericrescens]PLW78148.1 hypothetical protein C0081_05730 [Cohaesibacter celericrescens]
MQFGRMLGTELSPSLRNQIAIFYWFIGPFVALLGSAGSDIWLSIGAIFLLVSSIATRDWQWLRHPWMIAALVFWLWLVFTAAISDWPGNGFEDALPWIRFPLFAMICLLSLQSDEKLQEKLIWAMCLGLVIVSAMLIVERIGQPDADKLFGPWQQNRKAGWYVVGMGLPVCLWFMAKAAEKTIPVWVAVLLLALLVGTSVNSGEIYMTLLLLLGLGVFTLLARLGLPYIVACSVVSAVLVGVLAVAVPATAEAFISNLQNNLPWYPSSAYHVPWMEGLGVAKLNLLVGVGAENFENFCTSKAMLVVSSAPECNSHPHQIYIQTAAESGLIGLGLFVVMVILLFKAVFASETILKLSMKTAIAVTLLVTVFWPISSYSEAFGQHRNFFTWYTIGLALAFAKSASLKNSRLKDRV